MQAKSFRYKTPLLPLEPEHLIDSDLLKAQAFHVFLDPVQVIEQTAQLHEFRHVAGIFDRPFIIWEPKAYSCIPENLQAFVEGMRVVDVFSPNHIELAKIVGKDPPTAPEIHAFEQMCDPLMSRHSGSEPRGMIIVRAGDMGCFVKSTAISTFLPAYHGLREKATGSSNPQVIDTTGAGNSFFGGFAIQILFSPGDYISAACAGNVAASFAVEQVGLPRLTFCGDGAELWNDEEAAAWLHHYKADLGLW